MPLVEKKRVRINEIQCERFPLCQEELGSTRDAVSVLYFLPLSCSVNSVALKLYLLPEGDTFACPRNTTGKRFPPLSSAMQFSEFSGDFCKQSPISHRSFCIMNKVSTLYVYHCPSIPALNCELSGVKAAQNAMKGSFEEARP